MLVSDRNIEEVNNLHVLGTSTSTIVGNLQQQIDNLRTLLNNQHNVDQLHYLNLQETIIRIQAIYHHQQQVLQQLQVQHNTLSERVFSFLENPKVGIVLSNNLDHNNRNNITNSITTINNLINNTTPTDINENNITNNNTNNVVTEGIATTQNNNNEPTNNRTIDNRFNQPPNVLNRLRNEPRIPPLSVTFPDSWIRLLDQWETDQLSSFEGYGRRTHFSNQEKQRYSKRLRAILQLRKLSLQRQQSIREMAIQLDIERNVRTPPISLNTHLNELDVVDTSIHRRSRT